MHPFTPSPADDATRATLAGCGALAMWSVLALLSVQAAGLPRFQLLAMTFAVASLCGLGFMAASGRTAELRQPARAFLLSTGGLFGYHTLYFVALAHAPAVEASLLNYMWPVAAVAIAACMPGERFLPRHFLGVGLGLGGAVLLLSGQDSAPAPGDRTLGLALAFAGAVTWAAYSVLNRRFREVPSAAVFTACAATAVLGAAAHLALEETVLPDRGQALAVLGLGLGPVGFAFLLWDRGTKRGRIEVLAALSYGVPVLATLWLVLAGKATPSLSLAGACALVVAGAVVATRPVRTTRPGR